MMNISKTALASDIVVSKIPLPVLSGSWNIGASISSDEFTITKNPMFNNFVTSGSIPENLFSSLPITSIAQRRNTEVKLTQCASRGIVDHPDLLEMLPEFKQTSHEALSISFWIKPLRVHLFQPVVSLHSDNNLISLSVFMGPNGFVINTRNQTDFVSSTTLNYANMQALKWAHACLVISTTQEYSLYINGVKEASSISSLVPLFHHEQATLWNLNYIAYSKEEMLSNLNENYAASNKFVGEIKNAFIWSKELDDESIMKLFTMVSFVNATNALRVSYNPSYILDANSSYTANNLIKSWQTSTQTQNKKHLDMFT